MLLVAVDKEPKAHILFVIGIVYTFGMAVFAVLCCLYPYTVCYKVSGEFNYTFSYCIFNVEKYTDAKNIVSVFVIL